MSQAVRKAKEEAMEKYKKIMDAHSNPYALSLALEQDEAKLPIIDGLWAWDIVLKYFPLADANTWQEYYEIVKKAVKICQKRGVQIGIVFMSTKLTPREKKWVENGFYWKVKRYPKIGRLGKTDAKKLQQHRYNVIGGITKGGLRVLQVAGYKEEEAKDIFLTGTMGKLEVMNLLPESVTPRKKIEHKKEEK